MSRPKAFSHRSSRISAVPSPTCAISVRSRSCWSSNISTLRASSATISPSWIAARSSIHAPARPWTRRRSSGPWRFDASGSCQARRGLDDEGRGVQHALSDSTRTFAANRARGSLALAVETRAGLTRRARVQEQGPLRVRCPGPPTGELEAVIVNTAGGIAGGDRCKLAIDVAAGARLVVTTAAAEKVYRTLGPASIIDVALAVGSGGSLFWLPQETILFDRA